MFEEIEYEVVGGIATIRFNRPEKRNALGMRGYEELIEALQLAGADDHAGVIVISGAGKAFCSGGDIEMAQTVLRDESAARTHFFKRMIESGLWVQSVGKPVICSVHGACVGGGAELVTFADFIVADESAFFLYNGASIGGCSWWGGPQLLPVQVGMRKAEEILFLAKKVGAKEALELGLINRCVPVGELATATDELCQELLDMSEEGLRLTKAALRSTKEILLVSMSAHAEMNVAALGKPELHAAFDAFSAGQTMDWRGLRAGSADPSQMSELRPAPTNTTRGA